MYAPICHHSATVEAAAAAGKWEVLIGVTAVAAVLSATAATCYPVYAYLDETFHRIRRTHLIITSQQAKSKRQNYHFSYAQARLRSASAASVC